MRHIFYDSLKRFFVALIATLAFVVPSFAANLPTGYTELEYIRSDGLAYINTGYSPTSKTGYEVIAKMDANSGNRNIVGSGTSNSSGDSASALLTTNSYDDTHYEIKFTNSTPWDGTITSTTTEKHSLYMSSTQFKIDGAVVKTNSTTVANSGNKPLILFQRWRPTYSTTNNCVQIYGFKIWENNVLQMDLVPAKNARGVIGMYDTVSETFFTNAGTGSLTAGPEVLNPCRNLFDKNNRTRITGYFPSSGTAWHYAAAGYSNRIPCRPNTTYTARYNGNSTQVVLGFGSTSTDTVPTEASNVTVTQAVRQNSPTIDTPITITTGPNDKWLIVAYNVAEPQNTDMADNLQIEEGSTATAYVPYCAVGDGIKIATTKYTEDAFAGLMTTLSEAITKVTNIVDTTVQQATEIGNLATTKQDRPDTDCPAGRKCLLIMGADNKPHWYLIQE